ncbi:TetR/AcrR family transcriptional regulator [Lichenifustis flavocetrariae]|uniref:TetR/AcrR family transcriptional regulator n=1 Tax=Lichenifustis flavocetrariae TaxID=2949735 RepID=A0AA41YPX1_9HYPH|nr:TetR/AcrR family transcriptional regulator [Lichenifustis flavocetrariae]MCW6506404.1 TetR/AcrR family transcriptional regulator [Lichenifustis flavocetrariae]
MKVSKAKAAENRASLVYAAAKVLKEKGFEGAGVVEISARAGLTQGAFYGQFATKAVLAAEACRQDLAIGVADWMDQRGRGDHDALAYVKHYLRRGHVEDLAGGCPMATYAGEIVRQEPAIAAAFADGASAMVELMEEALGKAMPSGAARSRALFLIAALAGTVAMTRALGRTDSKLAEEMLEAGLLEAQRLSSGLHQAEEQPMPG